MIEVRDDRRRVIARIRVHGERLVDVVQIRRWSFADVRRVVTELTRLADRYEPIGSLDSGTETDDNHERTRDDPRAAGAATARVAQPLSPSPTDAPPMHGPGSSRVAWVNYAIAKGVQVTETMNRDAIVAAVRGKPVNV
jgi:hypothetical protein